MSFYSEFAACYEQVFPFREDVFSFLKGYAGPRGSAVLDIGCGPGHYCCRFARQGYAACGLDLDSRMIEVASSSCPDASFRCMDMAEVGSLAGPFMMVYSTGNVLSHLLPDKRSRFAASVHALLSPGGCWVFQVVNREAIAGRKEFVFPVKVLDDGQTTFHRRYSAISGEQVLFGFSLVKGDSTLFIEQFPLYPATSAQYRRLHEDAGFTSECVSGGFEGRAFNPEDSSALVMVFRKNG